MRGFAFFILLFAFVFALTTRAPSSGDASLGAPSTDATADGETAATGDQSAMFAASRTPGASAGNGRAGVTLDRAPDSHFYLDMQVNGRAVRFLVDTGASSVALSRADARRLGLQVGPHDFTGTAQTASGPAAFAPVQLDTMRAGPLEAQGVEAVVLDIEEGMPLLGQSFLRRLNEVRVQGDVMTFR